eukprot:scaffold4737_cov105-Isochrysis_galbana.AAC.3
MFGRPRRRRLATRRLTTSRLAPRRPRPAGLGCRWEPRQRDDEVGRDDRHPLVEGGGELGRPLLLLELGRSRDQQVQARAVADGAGQPLASLGRVWVGRPDRRNSQPGQDETGRGLRLILGLGAVTGKASRRRPAGPCQRACGRVGGDAPALERADERWSQLEDALFHRLKTPDTVAHVRGGDLASSDGHQNHAQAAARRARREARAPCLAALSHEGIAGAEGTGGQHPVDHKVGDGVGNLEGSHFVGDEAAVLLERLAQVLLRDSGNHIVDLPDHVVDALRVGHARLRAVERLAERLSEGSLIGPAEPLKAFKRVGTRRAPPQAATCVVPMHVEAIVERATHFHAAANLPLRDGAAAAFASGATRRRIIEPQPVRDRRVVAAVTHDW